MHLSARVFKLVFLAVSFVTFFLVIEIMNSSRVFLGSPRFDASPVFYPSCLGNASCVSSPNDSTTLVTEAMITTARVIASTCTTPLPGVAFIKTHKTGSTTLGHIMNRFGYQRNMSFVLHRKMSNGHLVYTKITKESPKNTFLKPLNARNGDYKNYKYDMITVHVRYYREAMNSFMKPDTRYITIIRDPGTQFESAFVHFQFDDALPGNKSKRSNLTSVATRMEEWFRNPHEYLQKLKNLSWEGIKGLRFYYAQNNQIFDLGLDVDKHKNETVVHNYIERLAKELDMVVITEYVEESLLVMKKQFCWSLEDILFIPKNQRSDLAKNYTVTPSLREKMREWNAVDYKLYKHFNDTLWKKIESYGEEFYEELKQYRRLLNATFDNCTQGSYFKGQGRMFQNINYKPANGTSELCQLIAEHKSKLMKRVRQRQLPPKPPVKAPKTSNKVKALPPVGTIKHQQNQLTNNTLTPNKTNVGDPHLDSKAKSMKTVLTPVGTIQHQKKQLNSAIPSLRLNNDKVKSLHSLVKNQSLTTSN